MNLFRLYITGIFICLSLASFSQYCGNLMPSSTDVCIQGSIFEAKGFPSSSDFPCIVGNVYTDMTSSFSCFSMDTGSLTIEVSGNTISIDTIYALRIDSINNLPCGICWATNKENNKIEYGEGGCLRFIGTTLDLDGFYELSVKISLDVTGGGFTLVNVSLNNVITPIFLHVINENATCDDITGSIVGNTASNCQ